MIAVLSLVGCAHPGSTSSDATASKNREADRERIHEQLNGEMSLKADRDELADMRKQIPAEKQKSNDELALYLQLMKQGKEQPQMVRDKFTSLVEKRRSSFRDKVQHLRETYRRDEEKRRDEFLDSQKKQRTAFTAAKRTPDEMKDFFGTQDTNRKVFFADERDRRTSFESEISAQSKDFESYMREKVNEFNEQYRLYSKQFSERPVEKKAVTGEGTDNDYKRIEQIPAKPIGSGSDD